MKFDALSIEDTKPIEKSSGNVDLIEKIRETPDSNEDFYSRETPDSNEDFYSRLEKIFEKEILDFPDTIIEIFKKYHKGLSTRYKKLPKKFFEKTRYLYSPDCSKDKAKDIAQRCRESEVEKKILDERLYRPYRSREGLWIPKPVFIIDEDFIAIRIASEQSKRKIVFLKESSKEDSSDELYYWTSLIYSKCKPPEDPNELSPLCSVGLICDKKISDYLSGPKIPCTKKPHYKCKETNTIRYKDLLYFRYSCKRLWDLLRYQRIKGLGKAAIEVDGSYIISTNQKEKPILERTNELPNKSIPLLESGNCLYCLYSHIYKYNSKKSIGLIRRAQDQ